MAQPLDRVGEAEQVVGARHGQSVHIFAPAVVGRRCSPGLPTAERRAATSVTTSRGWRGAAVAGAGWHRVPGVETGPAWGLSSPCCRGREASWMGWIWRLWVRWNGLFMSVFEDAWALMMTSGLGCGWLVGEVGEVEKVGREGFQRRPRVPRRLQPGLCVYGEESPPPTRRPCPPLRPEPSPSRCLGPV